MKITQLKTIRLGEFPNIIWVGLHTGEGVVGLGETFMSAQAVEAYLHVWVAPKLLGKDPLAIEVRNKDMMGHLGWRGSGVETRGSSAVHTALGVKAAMQSASTTPASATSTCAARSTRTRPTGGSGSTPDGMKTWKLSCTVPMKWLSSC